MSLTPFHPAVPWLPYARWPAAFSFWALTLGSMVPDLEVPLVFGLTGDIHIARGLMHSVLGVLTVNALITALAVWFLVPRILRWCDRTWPDRPEVLRFAGQDLRRDPRDWVTVYTSAAFGGLTHILADIPTHSYNPVWWPWQVGPLNLVPFSDAPWYDAVTTAVWLALFVLVFRAFWRR